MNEFMNRNKETVQMGMVVELDALLRGRGVPPIQLESICLWTTSDAGVGRASACAAGVLRSSSYMACFCLGQLFVHKGMLAGGLFSIGER